MPFTDPTEDTRRRWATLPISVVVDLVDMRGKISNAESAFTAHGSAGVRGKASEGLNYHRRQVVGHPEFGFTERALKAIASGIRASKLKNRLLSCIEAGLAKPWSVLYGIIRCLSDVRKRTRSDQLQRVLFATSQPIFKLLDPIDQLRVSVLQLEYLVLRRIERLLHIRSLLLRRLDIRLSRTAPCAELAEEFGQAIPRTEGRPDYGQNLRDIHSRASSCKKAPKVAAIPDGGHDLQPRAENHTSPFAP